MKFSIIGAGPAGVIAAETLAEKSPGAEITLISAEREPPYSRMALPYLLAGDIGEDGTHLRRNEGYYASHGISYIMGRVTGVDPAAKTIAFEDGQQGSYDKLLIAAGASPVRPPIEGLDLPGVQNCWTLEDARNIASIAKPGLPVVLVGAGFIGSIILEALVKMGVTLSVVEMGDRMVPRMMDDTAGNILRNWCEKEKGVRILTGTGVKNIAQADASDGGARLQVTLTDGQTLPAGLVVVAAGVRPNTAFLQDSGIATDIGVTVNEYFETSAPDIYAAGDAAQGKDLSTGKFDMLAIQPVAVEHGRLAALNMAGIKTPHRGSLNMNVLDTLGLISSSFGSWQGVAGGDSARLSDPIGYRYLRLEFDGDKLIGAQAVGMSEHIGMARGLIQAGTKLGAWKDKLLHAPERLSEAYVARAHGM